MDDALAVVEKVKALGVTISPSGEKILLEPGSKVPPELIGAIRQHKDEILAILTRGSQTVLTRALAQKNEELSVMQKRLVSPYYTDDIQYHEWAKQQIETIRGQIAEIQCYLNEGGDLNLPPCCKRNGYVCLIAMRKFDWCLFEHVECGFCLQQLRGEK